MEVELREVSLVSLLATFAALDCVETLFDVLHRAAGSAVFAVQVLETSGAVSGQLGVKLAAIHAAHVGGQVLAVEVGHVFVLVPAHENEVALRAEVALHVEFCLVEVKNVLGLAVNFLADAHEVDPSGLGAAQVARNRIFHFLLRLLFRNVLHLVSHSLFNAVKEESVRVFFVSLNAI